jgi:hypothetical protein
VRLLDTCFRCTKTLITNKCTKRVLSSIVTHSYMFRPCWVIFRENFFCCRYTKVALYSWMRMCCWLCTALFLEAWTLCGPGLHGRAVQARAAKRVHASSTQSTAHSYSTIKCNLSVTVTESSPWRWPSRVETCRSVLRLMIKFSLCICWWLVFLYIAHAASYETEQWFCNIYWKDWIQREDSAAPMFLTLELEAALSFEVTEPINYRHYCTT